MTDHRRLGEVLLVGTVGSLLLALWALADRYPGHVPGTSPVEMASWVAGALGVVALVWAWLRSRPLRGHRALMVGAWTVPLLPVPPLLSLDAWAYAAQGWLLAHGMNPYLVPQGRAADLGLHVDAHWVATTAVYPPGSLWVQAAMTALAGYHPYWSTVAMRIPGLLALVLIGLAVTRLAQLAGADVDRVRWFTVANPLVLLHVVGGMHNDGLQCAVGLWALVVGWTLARSGRSWAGLVAGGLLVGLAGTLKQPGVLFGLGLVALVHVEAVRSGRQRDGWGRLVLEALAGALPAIGSFAAISAIGGLGLGWLNDTAGSPASVTSDAPIALLVQIIGWTGVPVTSLVPAATATSLVLTAAAIIVCWVRWGPVPGRTGNPGRPVDPLLLQAGVLLAFALCGAGLQPWYLVGPLLLVAVTTFGSRRLTALTILTVAVVALSFLQWFSSPFLALPLVAVGTAMLWRPASDRLGAADRPGAD